MKSFESGGQCLPLLSIQPPFSFIDDTKVQEVVSLAKDKKRYLLNGYFVAKSNRFPFFEKKSQNLTILFGWHCSENSDRHRFVEFFLFYLWIFFSRKMKTGR